MAQQRDEVNPLRPYYIPPSIGDAPNPSFNSGRYPLAGGNGGGDYTRKAREAFSDVDYKDYISGPPSSIIRSTKDVLDDLLWRYTSVLLAQPFEVAKTLLQVRDGVGSVAETVPNELDTLSLERQYGYEASAGDPFAGYESDPDEPSYFAPNVPSTSSASLLISRKPPTLSPSPITSPHLAAARLSEHQLLLRKPGSILEVMSQLWHKEGAWGVWKGSNASFLYSVLQHLLENWSRSLLSALFDVPDLGLKDDIDRLIDIASPYPWASLFIAATAAVATSLFLAPLDLVRTR
ncbi:Mitochondrial carrier domain protein [Niveomyces insectorum RCEF 264]|uniref:Mitochondrial carrier domain protein n=1 Tax=Niveomyces insectorum RCEF 264 TaxID=1081102 RepID=A0A167NFS7_9HYPO|nr:Mitochondrial carrier domain protein [Niveomyces insectorum RCEF 264]